jgi:hypothetical protein
VILVLRVRHRRLRRVRGCRASSLRQIAPEPLVAACGYIAIVGHRVDAAATRAAASGRRSLPTDGSVSCRRGGRAPSWVLVGRSARRCRVGGSARLAQRTRRYCARGSALLRGTGPAGPPCCRRPCPGRSTPALRPRCGAIRTGRYVRLGNDRVGAGIGCSAGSQSGQAVVDIAEMVLGVVQCMLEQPAHVAASCADGDAPRPCVEPGVLGDLGQTLGCLR